MSDALLEEAFADVGVPALVQAVLRDLVALCVATGCSEAYLAQCWETWSAAQAGGGTVVKPQHVEPFGAFVRKQLALAAAADEEREAPRAPVARSTPAAAAPLGRTPAPPAAQVKAPRATPAVPAVQARGPRRATGDCPP